LHQVMIVPSVTVSPSCGIRMFMYGPSRRSR
jgi:hypothetical protein